MSATQQTPERAVGALNKPARARVQYHIGRASGGACEPALDGPIALVVSDFDGAHTGHAELARRGGERAEAAGARLVALLPWPSPAGGDNAAASRLTTLAERLARLQGWGVFSDIIVVPALAEERDAAGALAAMRALGDLRALVCEAAPTGAALALLPSAAVRLAAGAGLSVAALGGADALGARIAGHLESGRLSEATAALGYAYSVTGEVVGGDRRGRLLGYPTANLRPDPSKIIPANGVYAARVRLPGDAEPCQPAVVSVGVRPTFGADNRRLIEAHLLDAALDLYGMWIEVEFVDYLRPELRFENVEALITQMDQDSEQSRRLLSAK